MENITEIKIKTVAEEKSKVNPEPKLKLWNKLYDKFGTEHRVVNMSLHIDINYSPEWNYSIVSTSSFKIHLDGYIHYSDDVFIGEDDINVKYFTTRPSISQRMKAVR